MPDQFRPQQSAPSAHGEDLRPVADIVKDLWHHTELLVQQESHALRAEAEVRIEELKVEATMFATAGAVVYAALLSLVAGLTLLLSRAVEPWLAAIIMALALSVVAFGMFRRGQQVHRRHAQAHRSLTSVASPAGHQH
jgi:hypothetical protein